MSFVHLILGDHHDNLLKTETLSVLCAAQQIPGTYHGLILGFNLGFIAKQFSNYVSQVHVADDFGLINPLPELYAKVIADVARLINATHIWASANVLGKDTMPRVAVRLNAAMISSIETVLNENTYKRSILSGNAIATIAMNADIQIITVRTTAFMPTQKIVSGLLNQLEIKLEHVKTKYLGFACKKSFRPALNDADIIVAGGRGCRTREGFRDLIEPLANHLNAAIGGTRAACDSGWISHDSQIGQTGKIVAPKLYIAIGISGAIQHVAGIKNSRVIVAINIDPQAPIFKICDYGIIGDIFIIIPQLLNSLKKRH